MFKNKKLIHFTLIDIIERNIHFTKTNTIFDKIENQYNDEGELLAYNEMLNDAKIMDENEFVQKYLNKIKKLSIQFENQEFKDEIEIEKMSGYNNAIVSILKCINPIYFYDIEDSVDK